MRPACVFSMSTFLPVCLTALFALASLPAAAQPIPRPPDAGQILKEVTPAPEQPLKPKDEALPTPPKRPLVKPTDGGIQFTVRSVSFKGNTVYSAAQLDDAVRGYVGKKVGMVELQALAEAVAQRYLRDGYFLAQAFYEPQDVSEGDLQVSILEGTLGRVRVEKAPDAPIPERLVQGLTRRLTPGKPINQRDLERAMLLLVDQPGIVAQSSLEAGTVAGTTDLIIEINKGRRLRVAFDADNYGTYSTGDYRVGASLRWSSPLGLGDAVDVRPVVSSDGGVLFGRAGYELPIGGSGARLAAGVGRLQYELQRQFAALGLKGYATTADVGLSYPLIRSRGENLYLQAGIAGKWLEDRFEAAGVSSDKRVLLGSLGLSYERRDRLLGGGYTSIGGTLFAGRLSLDSPADEAFDQSPAGRDTQGGFTKFVLSLSRLQAVRGPVTAFLGVSGQLAGKNLDNAERIALGGPYAVRAYPASEGIVDQGVITTAELRWSIKQEVTASVFYDYAWGELSKDPVLGLPNTVTLGGFGVGLSWIRLGNFSLRASVAWPTTGAALSDPRDREPRVFAQAVKLF